MEKKNEKRLLTEKELNKVTGGFTPIKATAASSAKEQITITYTANSQVNSTNVKPE